jgi:hypothetical protein
LLSAWSGPVQPAAPWPFPRVSPAEFPAAGYWDVGRAGSLLRTDHVFPPGLADHLPDRREPDVHGRGGESFHARPPLHQQRPGERPAGTEGEQVVEHLGVVAPE